MLEFMANKGFEVIEAIGENPKGHCLECDVLFEPATQAAFLEHVKTHRKKREGLSQAAVKEVYIPKVNDTVFQDGHGFVRYLVAAVNPAKKTADIRTTSGLIVLTRDVPWSKLHQLDESQNAARIVREATEDR
jgi:hypothetical protein